MTDAKHPPPVIDLTDEKAAAAHSITPELQRPNKQRRISRRIQNRATSSDDGQSCCKKDTAAADIKASPASVESEQPSKLDNGAAYRKNDYYEVEQILERRTKNYGGDLAAGGRNVVEYLVKWKNPPDYTGEGSYWEDSWQIAENLDPHSLAVAFRLFPVDGDPDRNNNETAGGETESEDYELDLNLDDDLFEEEDDVAEEEALMIDNAKDDGEYDVVEEIDVQKCNDIAHLGDSEYDGPGTVELELNRKTFRVGQSFISPDGSSYTISTILPTPRKAKCLKYIKMEACFACPKGKEDMFIQLSDEVILDLSLLKTYAPSTLKLKKFSMKYEESDNQRSFCYCNESAKVHHHPTSKPTVLELFAGVGGMSLGLEKAGFDVKWIVDSDEVAAATLTANKRSSNMNINVYTEKLSSFLKNCMQEDPAYPKPGEVDHIHASPPCKGFSRANRNGGKDDMTNNKQTLLFVKAVQHFRPKTVSFENVAGLLTPDFKGYLKSVVASLLAMQYQVRVQVYNASSYGDPQHRRRLFILASRHDCLLPSSPLPTHGLGRNLLPIKTCKDALQMFDKEPTGSGAVMSLSSNTKIWNHIAPRIAPNKEKDYELKAEEPSRTILARSRPHVHYNGNRYISVREAAALQSFPSDYRFFGSLSSQYSQVGNAVPICLATAISRSVIRVHGAP